MDYFLKFITKLFLLSLVSTCLHAELGSASFSSGHGAWVKSSHTLVSAKPLLYNVKKITTQDDIEIHEYITTSGVVFGMAWSGESKPDLSWLLGRFFSRYQLALSQIPSARSPIAINTTDFVLQTGGRMNQFVGLAYLPALAPQGVSINDIQ
jgi:hypothetical protein